MNLIIGARARYVYVYDNNSIHGTHRRRFRPRCRRIYEGNACDFAALSPMNPLYDVAHIAVVRQQILQYNQHIDT